MTKEIIAKIDSGEPLTDEELRDAIKFYTLAENSLALLGRAFCHARHAVSEQLETLQRWAEARAAKA